MKTGLAILVVALAASPVSEAGVFASAVSGNGVNVFSVSGSTYAHAEAVSSGSLNTPTYSGNTYTSQPPNPCTFPCIPATVGRFELSAASIDALTGKGRAYAHAQPGAVAPTGGLDFAFAEAGFTLSDRLTINTAVALMVTLNLDLDTFFTSATAGANDFSVISAIYSLAFVDPADSLLRYELRIVAEKDVYAGVGGENYRIAAGWDDGPLSVIAQGTSVPLALSATIAAPVDTLLPTQVFDLELSLYVHATCQTLGPPACSAVSSAPNSTHIGLVGAYTSQNGYGYLGLDPGSTAVPEPSTIVLVGVAVAVLGVRRARIARQRSLP